MTDRIQTPAHVGVVGLGAMGGPIARHLLAAGFDVRCADPDEAATGALVTAGARVAPDAATLGAECAATLLIVPTDDDVLIAGKEVLSRARPGGVLAVCSSVRPETCRELAALAGDRSVAVLDVALTGGVRGAEAGTANLLVGGEPDDLQRIRPVLAAFSSGAHHLGPLGCGQVGKTVNNLVHWAQIAAITEALSLGERLGVPAARLRRALRSGPTDSRTLREIEQMRLTWWAKDLDNSLRMAQESGTDLPLARRVRELMPGISVQSVADLLEEG